MEISREDFMEMLKLVEMVNTETNDNSLTITTIRRIKEILSNYCITVPTTEK
jgi:hypothetical protein